MAFGYKRPRRYQSNLLVRNKQEFNIGTVKDSLRFVQSQGAVKLIVISVCTTTAWPFM
jgi:hypothetical protein